MKTKTSCCPNCGEGYENEEEWSDLNECALCGHPKEYNMKTFKGDFDFFVNKIRNNEHFSLSRWGDGELMILENKPIDLRHKGDGEFRHDPNNAASLKMRDILMKSYTYKDKDYHIGIACRCCVGDDKFNYMKKLSEQPDSNLTWANIFVNSNYKHFLVDFIESLQGKKVILVSNVNSKIDKLPFKIETNFYVGTDAWISDYAISGLIKLDMDHFKRTDHIYLLQGHLQTF